MFKEITARDLKNCDLFIHDNEYFVVTEDDYTNRVDAFNLTIGIRAFFSVDQKVLFLKNLKKDYPTIEKAKTTKAKIGQCQKCLDEGKRSKVYDEGSTRTLMGYSPYYDEGGNYHHHNPNRTTTGYRCSNGHKWISKTRAGCNACNTLGDEKIEYYE